MNGMGVRRFVFAALAGCAALVACSDDGDPTDPLADCLAQAGVIGPAVGIVDFEFEPATLTVQPGQSVTWVNCGDEAHTTTSDGGVWDSALLQPGEAFSRTFAQAGTFPYHCTPHPFMQATVMVEP